MKVNEFTWLLENVDRLTYEERHNLVKLGLGDWLANQEDEVRLPAYQFVKAGNYVVGLYQKYEGGRINHAEKRSI